MDVLTDTTTAVVQAWGPGLPHPDLAWGLWLGGTLVSFGVMEGLALAKGDMNATLSRRLRAWLGIYPHRPWRMGGIAVFLGFFAWFLPHIVFGVGA